MTQKATLNNIKSVGLETALMLISSMHLGQVPPLGNIFLHQERRDLFMRTWRSSDYPASTVLYVSFPFQGCLFLYEFQSCFTGVEEKLPHR